MTRRDRLRVTFNTIAREYDAVRPGYPPALIEDVITLSGLPPGGRCLEIGCGTGQATLPFARRGYHLVCLDIGADMLAVAAERLAAYPNVRLVLAAFEEWQPGPEPFDLVFSATAFHWIPPEVSYEKPAQVLKPGGALAIIYNMHPRPDHGFFVESQNLYRQYDPDWREPTRRSVEDEIQAHMVDVNASGLYEPVIVRTYPWSAVYSTADYLRLINTYSGHLALPETNRRALYAGLAELLDRRYGGQVQKEYLGVFYLARKPGGGKKPGPNRACAPVETL
jgi:SAM-dependent methyltransferase